MANLQAQPNSGDALTSFIYLLRYERLEKWDMTQDEAAKFFNIPSITYKRIELGKAVPDFRFTYIAVKCFITIVPLDFLKLTSLPLKDDSGNYLFKNTKKERTTRSKNRQTIERNKEIDEEALNARRCFMCLLNGIRAGEKKITQEDVADSLYMSESTFKRNKQAAYSKAENGTKNLDFRFIYDTIIQYFMSSTSGPEYLASIPCHLDCDHCKYKRMKKARAPHSENVHKGSAYGPRSERT